jgi:hypothetical protein
MVISNLDVVCVAVLEMKAYSPLIIDRDRVSRDNCQIKALVTCVYTILCLPLPTPELRRTARSNRPAALDSRLSTLRSRPATEDGRGNDGSEPKQRAHSPQLVVAKRKMGTRPKGGVFERSEEKSR